MFGIKISAWNVISTISIISIVPVFLTLPRYAAIDFATGAVIHSVFVTIIILALFLISSFLLSSFKDKDIIDIAEIAGGKFTKILFCIVLILFLILLISCTLREFSQDIKNVLFTKSSIDEISILFIIGMAIGGFFGINGIFRISGLFFPILLVSIILIFFSLFNKIDLTNLTPVLGNGSKEIFLNGFYKIGRFNFFALLLILNPYIKNFQKTGFISLLVSGTIISLLLFLLFSIMPYPTLLENYFSIFELTRLVGFGRFFQRFESVFTFLWIMATYIYISAAFSLILYSIKKAFNLKYVNRILPILTILVWSATHFMPSYNFAILLIDSIYRYIGPIAMIAFPILLIIIAKTRTSLGGKNETF